MNFKMLTEQLEEINIFEQHIINSMPSKIYAFSPKIYNTFNDVSQNINNLPKYSLVYIGNDSFFSAVYFYRCSKNIVHIFLIGINGIQEHYLL